MNKDLTVGKPEKVLWAFCLPLFGSIIFQQLYNIADSLVAGKFIGENALAAVGNSYEITLIFIAFAFGCNIGCSVITSMYFGSKEYGKMKTAVSTAMIMTGVICVLIMLIGTIFCGGLLNRFVRQMRFSLIPSFILIFMFGDCLLYFSIMLQRVFSQPWVIQRHHFISWLFRLYPILPWISGLLLASIWELLV